MKKIAIVFNLILVLALPLALGLGGCGPKKEELKVEMTDFAFKPGDISVPAGAKVTITLTNNGSTNHDFVIMKSGKEASVPFGKEDEANIYWEKEVEVGDTQTVTFTAPSDPGEYQIVCSVPGHLEAGMKGTLTVE